MDPPGSTMKPEAGSCLAELREFPSPKGAGVGSLLETEWRESVIWEVVEMIFVGNWEGEEGEGDEGRAGATPLPTLGASVSAITRIAVIRRLKMFGEVEIDAKFIRVESWEGVTPTDRVRTVKSWSVGVNRDKGGL